MDHELFNQIYLKYEKQVFHFLLNLSGSYDTAEELTQETFVRAYQSLDQFRGECRLYVWLCQIGKNQYFNYLKREGRFASINEIKHTASPQNLEQDVLDSSMARNIMEITARLPEPYQSVFLYRAFSQFSYKEIGDLMQKTEVWARVTYYRAKKMMQEYLKEAKLYEM